MEKEEKPVAQKRFRCSIMLVDIDVRFRRRKRHPLVAFNRSWSSSPPPRTSPFCTERTEEPRSNAYAQERQQRCPRTQSWASTARLRSWRRGGSVSSKSCCSSLRHDVDNDVLGLPDTAGLLLDDTPDARFVLDARKNAVDGVVDARGRRGTFLVWKFVNIQENWDSVSKSRLSIFVRFQCKLNL